MARRGDHVATSSTADILAGAVAGLGGAIAIGVMEWFSVAAHYPLAVIPFATSIVLVIGSPEAEPAQPRALVGGHLVVDPGRLCGAEVHRPASLGGGAAVGLSILAMYVTGTFHPQAGINPLLVVSSNLPCSFLLAPVLAGVLLLTAFAFAWHRWFAAGRGRSAGPARALRGSGLGLASCSVNDHRRGPG